MTRNHSNRFLLTTLAIGLLLSYRSAALAHAILLEASPAVDSTVDGPNVSVKLRFNVRIDRSRSRLTLLLTDGKSATLVIKDDDSPDTLSAEATELARGAYHLRWQVLASDGHITRGEIPFWVSSP